MMNEAAAESTGTTKTTRKRTTRSRKKVAPKEIAQGAVPAPSRSAPEVETETRQEPSGDGERSGGRRRSDRQRSADEQPERQSERQNENSGEARTEQNRDSDGADGGRPKRKRSRSKASASPKPESSEAPDKAPAKDRSASRMLINYIPGDECRVALTVDGKLEEFHSERANNLNIVGNIYVGKVMNVERSIQAAFIDFGYGVNGFLHISDLHPQYFPGEDENTTEKIGKKTPRRERPPIERCLKRGQKILVQVLKEGISTKGPTLTSYLSIPGRFLVMLPDMDKVGVSRKVEDEDQRRTMRKILDSLDLPKEFGFILRTAGMNQTKAELKRDLAYLQRLWKDIDKRLGQGDKPRLLYAESDLLMRALRDI
jgi:ribonuclease E